MTRATTLLVQQAADKVREDFEARLARVAADYTALLEKPSLRGGRFDVRELAETLLTMDELERYVLLNRVISDTSGPKSLEGMENLKHFVSYYMLDDGMCVVVPEPDAEDLEDDAAFQATLGMVRFDRQGTDEATIRQEALEIYRARERPLVVVICGDETPNAGPFEILAAIEHNRALEAKREEAFADFMNDDDFTPGP